MITQGDNPVDGEWSKSKLPQFGGGQLKSNVQYFNSAGAKIPENQFDSPNFQIMYCTCVRRFQIQFQKKIAS